MNCQDCASGQISDEHNSECVAAPTCDGTNEIFGVAANCYQCDTCV